MYGIVTPGDIYRAFLLKKPFQINRKFQYLCERNDEVRAEEIFEKYPTIHEIAVVEDGCLIGVVKSGRRKTLEEWRKIRKSFDEKPAFYDDTFADIKTAAHDKAWHEKKQAWIRKDIRSILKIKCRTFIYRPLRVEDMCLSDSERILFNEKVKLPLDKEGLCALGKRERDVFFGENVTEEYLEKLIWLRENTQIVYKNGIPVMQDIDGSPVWKIQDGYRAFSNPKNKARRKIFLFGPCTIFGRYVSDSETIGAYLDKYVHKAGFDYEVIIASDGFEFGIVPRIYGEKIGEKDIVIIMSYNFDEWKSFEEDCDACLSCQESMAEVWREIDSPLDNIFNGPEHCNAVVNQVIAKKMFHDIKGDLTDEPIDHIHRERLQNYYISWDVVEYYDIHFRKYVDREKMCWGRKNGAIVMNCNPFTKGHLYLIEEAAKQVEHLFIFVVQEDKSDFLFKERFYMVKEGCKHFDNICVIPSGQYIISSETFEQYFEKENVSAVEDMDYDVHIFGEVVAKELNICCRFVGEEPFDIVTKHYNETMKRILPEYGIDVIELPRLASKSGEIISASKVRKYIRQNRLHKLKEMLPESTLKYLEEMSQWNRL